MIELSNVTLLSVNCVRPMESIHAMRHSMSGIKFKEAILYTHSFIMPQSGLQIRHCDKLDWNGYNDFMLTLADNIDSDFVLIVQDDGFVTNPDMWDPKFLEYDYIGAPWPNEPSWIQQQTLAGDITYIYPFNRVGNGGFSLRSRKFLQACKEFKSCEGLGEDAFLCTKNYPYMRKKGIKFAPLEMAYRFSYENPLLEYGHHWNASVALDPMAHFGFHGRQFRNSAEIINLKNP